MAITIDTDHKGRIWRWVDGIPTTELFECTEEEAEILGVVRYGAAYPGERWETPGMTIRPADVPRLYCVPPAEAPPHD